MVPRPLIFHIVALRLIKWCTPTTYFTINPLVSVSHSLTIANKNNNFNKGYETFMHSHLQSLTSPAKEELLSFHFLLIFTTRVSLFP